MTRHFTQDKALHRKQSITRKALHSRQGISRKTRQYTQDKSLHKRQGISRKKREFLQDMGLHEMQVIKRKTKLFCAAGVVGERDGPHLHHHDPRQHPRSATSACYCGRGGGLKNLHRRKTTCLADIFRTSFLPDGYILPPLPTSLSAVVGQTTVFFYVFAL